MDNGGPWLPTLSVRGPYPTGVLRLLPPSSWEHLEDQATWLWLPGAPSGTPVCAIPMMSFSTCATACERLGNTFLDRHMHVHDTVCRYCECSSKELLRSAFPGQLACSPQLQLMLTTAPLFSFPTDTFTVPGPCHNAIYTGSREK